ncbi:MAG: cell division protein SepF [Candidatus Nanopelagicaceae bacterium]
MSSLKKLGNFLGLTDDLESEEISHEAESPRIRVRESRSFAAVQATPTQSVSQAVAAPATNQIFTVNPRSYNEARVIGERYREGNTVLMNLTDMGDEERKRLVDFASGLVFGHHGTIERVTSKVFLLSPANVTVSSEVKTAAAEASFFNQS